jgi:hypothetical protein
MIRNFIIGASLVALGVIVAGSLESARIASPQFAAAEGRSPFHAEHTAQQIGWQRNFVLPQAGAAVRPLARIPRIASGK